jgi:hypothetical protein
MNAPELTDAINTPLYSEVLRSRAIQLSYFTEMKKDNIDKQEDPIP